MHSFLTRSLKTEYEDFKEADHPTSKNLCIVDVTASYIDFTGGQLNDSYVNVWMS